MTAIGLDIGGGSTKIGVISATGHLLDSRRVVIVPGQTADDIIAAYIASIADLAGDSRLPIGVAYPGHIDHGAKIGLNSNVLALDGQPLCERLGHHFGTQTALLNDADAAAYAESLCHPEGVTGRFLVVTLGTGIGVAVTVKGQTLVTAGGTLGDAGHLNLDPSGQFQCRMGCTGCLESLASAGAIERDAALLAETRPDSALALAMDASGLISAATVCRLALAGDPDATTLVARMEDWLAMAVASWRAMFHPDLICFGGGLSALGQDFIHRLQTKSNARSLPFLTNSPLRLATLGNEAGMIGAGLKALHLPQEQETPNV
ncbi:MAG: ROK family protein [Paracoccaceae bacterium]